MPNSDDLSLFFQELTNIKNELQKRKRLMR